MATELTAAQKIRQGLTGDPFGEPVFASHGEEVVYWFTGGSDPDAWVTQHPDPENQQIVVRCAGCQTAIGHLPLDPFEKEAMAKQIMAIRLSGHERHTPANWPDMNISKVC